MSKVIIGIHGLANKPPKAVLKGYWESSIAEGLENRPQHSGGFPFELVYWADLMYEHAQHQDPLRSHDTLYDSEPYTPSKVKLTRQREGMLDWLRSKGSEAVGAGLDVAKEKFGIHALADWVLGKTLKDLDYYYDPNRKILDGSQPPAKGVARDILKAVLHREIMAHAGKEIMLIAHSMGSIIAYDVLRDIGRQDRGFQVDHFLTIGSPLGFPHVKSKVVIERDYAKNGTGELRTPTVVRKSWVNYSDRQDVVALDTHLSDDYDANMGGIKVRDDIIYNSYVAPDGSKNRHKSYGYLRTAEMSEKIVDFLQS